MRFIGPESVLRLLARRPYSSAEISRYLRRHQMDDEIIQNVIDDLTEAKLIDDDAFAAYWAEQRETFRPAAAWPCARNSARKASSVKSLPRLCPTWTRSTQRGGSRGNKAGRWRGLAEAEWRTKMTRYLMRHGYPYDVVSEVVTETWLEVKPDEDE